MGALFVVAWAIGMATVSHPAWFVHLPLLIGGAAILYWMVRRRAASL